MKSAPRTSPISRRRLLAAAASALAVTGVSSLAWAQSPQAPFLLPRPSDPNPAPPQPPRINETNWFVGSVPDGPFEIRMVKMDLLDPAFRRQLVPYSGERPGTIVVDPRNHFLYSVRENGEALRYGVGVGREGFGWNGAATVQRKAEWPDWHPPKEMRLRQPELPEMMPGGPDNPLGARALYLYQGNRDTLYRIHGTAEPWFIGRDVSSGCIRMLNEEIVDLYRRTPIGTRVVVL